jgi:hypothetical protein
MCRKVVNLQVILGLNLLKQYIDTLSRIHHFLTAEETLFIFIGDMKGIITLFDMLLKTFSNR